MTQNDTFPFGQEIVWEPNPQWMAESNLQTFMDRHDIDSYDKLLARANQDIAWFWDAVMEDLASSSRRPTSRSSISATALNSRLGAWAGR